MAARVRDDVTRLIGGRIWRSVWLRFLAYYLPAVIGGALLGYWFVVSQIDEERNLTIAEERTTVLLERQFFEDELNAAEDDVNFLARLASGCLQDLGGSTCPLLLKEAFLLFGEEHLSYSRILLLDAAGIERVRVEGVKNGHVLIPESELQIRSANPSYQNALKYRNSIWVSSIQMDTTPLDSRRVVRPLLNISKAVLDSAGRLLGVVVLSFDASLILETIAKHESASPGWHYLFRDTGEEIRSPVAGAEEKLGPLPERFPELWRAVSQNSSGTVSTDEGLFTYEKICPMLLGGKVPHLVSGPVLEECWIVVSHVPWSAIGPEWAVFAPWVGGGVLVLLGVGMWTWAWASVRRRQAERSLRRSEERLKDVIEAAGEFIWECDAELRFTYISGRVRDVLGYEPHELLGNKPIVLIPRDNIQEYQNFVRKTMAEGKSFRQVEFRNITKSGRIVYVFVSATPIFDESGRVQGMRGASLDITKRRKAQEKLRESEQKARAMLEASHDAMMVIDAKGRIQFWNRSAEKMFGYTEEEALGMDVHNMVAEPGDYAKAIEGMNEFAKTGQGPVVGNIQEYMASRKDGSQLPVEHAVASFMVGDEWFAVGSVRDKTEQKLAEAELKRLATTDSLTGIANRRHFMERCQQELERHRRYGTSVSLVMVDVDDFKKINDTWGHDVGDRVLVGVAEQLGNHLREVDLYGRIGGEEFAVLLPETNQDGAMQAAERLRQAMENVCYPVGEAQICITISLGVAPLRGKEENLESLLKRADDALFEAKKTGRNKIVTLS